MNDDFFSEFDSDQPLSNQGQGTTRNNEDSQNYTEEIFSKKIRTRKRTYFIDVKQSMYGKFVKISEKSNAGKRTIMFDEENMDEIISALQEARGLL